MDALPSSSHHIKINCSHNQNDGGTQNTGNIKVLNTKNVNNYYAMPLTTCRDLDQKQVPFPHLHTVGAVFEKNIEMVLKWLEDFKTHTIGVWGMGGVGKTTLLKCIYNKLLLSSSSTAQSTYWVVVSQNCTLTMLQEKIAQPIGLNLIGEESEERRAALLYHRLREMKRVRLILDDVWDSFATSEIGIPGEEDGCKIIFSTRKRGVCRSMGCEDFVVHVKPLTWSEAWGLFVHKLGNYEALPGEVKQIAVSVVVECHCLPLAIKTIASSLKGVRDIHEWQSALYELKNIDSRHEDMEDKVLKILKFSYDRLKNDQLRSCFLDCALYPEDHRIRREELIDLFIMEGLLDAIKERPMQVNKGNTLLNQLENSCLLEPCVDCYNRKSVKMHDLVREMAVMIIKGDTRFMAKSGLHLKNLQDNELWNKDLVKVSLSHNNVHEILCDLSPKTPNLAVLFLNNNNLIGIPESFFLHMKSLKILNLSWTDIESLPDSVADLKDLRMLLLNGCEKLKYVPSLGELSKLRVLHLPFPNFQGRWGLGEVTRGLEKLKSLEVLEYCQWKTSDVIHFNRFIESAKSLTRYSLSLSNEDGVLVEYMDYGRNFNIRGEKFGDDKPLPKIPRTVEWLYAYKMEIERVNNVEDVLLPSLADLMLLKCLELYFCKGFRYVEIPLRPSCQLETLEYLIFVSVLDLKRMTKYGAYNFFGLKLLRIENCPRIEVGIPIKSAHHTLPVLPNLERISVWNCREMKEIFEKNDISSSSSEIDGYNFEPILALPKLCSLSFHYLPKLGSIYRGLLLCTSLLSIEIDECPELNLLPLSQSLICNRSQESRDSIPKQEERPEWWKPLLDNYPEDALTLSRFKALGSLDDDDVSVPTQIDIGANYFEEDANLFPTSQGPSKRRSEAMLPLSPTKPTKRGKYSPGPSL